MKKGRKPCTCRIGVEHNEPIHDLANCVCGAAKLLAILRAKGSDARDIRDAAHEATHVLQTKSKSWNRDEVHEALERKVSADHSPREFRTMMVRQELVARGVELLVCQHFGIEYDKEHWATICWMETSKAYGVSIGEIDRVVEAFEIVSKQIETQLYFRRVIDMRAPRAKVIGAPL